MLPKVLVLVFSLLVNQDCRATLHSPLIDYATTLA
jgi:hypothetical protein